MQINPKSKSVSYHIDKLEFVEDALNEIERIALERDGVDGQEARDIVSNLNFVRDSLCFKRGIQRHEKFSPELQSK